MMKKLFGFVLAFCLMAGLLCVTAFAAEEPGEDVLLRISAEKKNGTVVTVADYKDFVEGWDAAMKLGGSGSALKQNAYVRVIVDIYADWNAVNGEFYQDGRDAICFPENVRITLNLNGHTINRGLSEYQYNGCVLYIDEKADVVINDGTITGGFSYNTAGGIHIEDDAKVVLNSVNVVGNTVHQNRGAAIAMYDNASLTMNGGRISDNVIYAFYNTFEPGEGTLYVSESTAVLNDVTISGNRAMNYVAEGVAIAIDGDGSVTMNNGIVENNGRKDKNGAFLAGSIFFGDAKNGRLILNKTTVRNNGASGTYDNNLYTSLFFVNGSLQMNGCNVTGNAPATIFHVWDTYSTIGNIQNSVFTDNVSQIIRCYGYDKGAVYTFTGCRFHNNKGLESLYSFEGDYRLKLTLVDCDLGNSTFTLKKYINITNARSFMTASAFGEGSLVMVIAVAALVVSCASLGMQITSKKKKPAYEKSSGEDDE